MKNLELKNTVIIIIKSVDGLNRNGEDKRKETVNLELEQ